ncbi:hypothetical protein ACIRP7_00105 [Streptomyces sp. NPDC102270]|uniref:hypothetical protein n=1 Tax=Streptomyces sp. NPDC102270 TaxID=3366150 RepID=UPI00380E6E06
MVTTGARRVVLMHWDDFFLDLHRLLRPMPYFVDDLDATTSRLLPWPAATVSTSPCPSPGTRPPLSRAQREPSAEIRWRV